MIKTKKGLRHKNKLTGHADTEPSVSADFIAIFQFLYVTKVESLKKSD